MKAIGRNLIIQKIEPKEVLKTEGGLLLSEKR